MNPFNKINELSSFKCNLATHISKIRDTVIELDSRELFHNLEFNPKQHR